MAGVQVADEGDALEIATTFGSAFAVDPMFCWMTDQADTERRLRPFWRSLMKAGIGRSSYLVFRTEDRSSAAVWRDVDRWKTPMLEMVGTTPAMLAAFRHRLPRAIRSFTMMEKAHPAEPHYYLEILGTRRDRQGSGAGSAVLAPMLARCDAERVPAYLESSNLENVAFYRRHGFVERGLVAGPKGAPPVTAMWRDPR